MNQSWVYMLSHPYVTTGKTIALTRWTFVSKVMSLLFNMLPRLVIAFFPKEQASFNIMAAVTICSDFGAQKNKIYHCFHCLSIYFPWSDETGCHDFLNVEFEASFFTLLFPFHQESLSARRVGHLNIWGYWYFLRQSWFQLVLHPGWHFMLYTLHIS